MDEEKKSGVGVLDKTSVKGDGPKPPSSPNKPTPATTNIDPQKAKHQKDQEYVVHQLSQTAGERIRKLALSIKASPKLRGEIEDLANDIEESVPRLAKKTKSPEALSDQVSSAVEKAEKYIVDLAKAEAEKEKKAEKKKEAKDHKIHPREVEKPAKANKTVEEKNEEKVREFEAELQAENDPKPLTPIVVPQSSDATELTTPPQAQKTATPHQQEQPEKAHAESGAQKHQQVAEKTLKKEIPISEIAQPSKPIQQEQSGAQKILVHESHNSRRQAQPPRQQKPSMPQRKPGVPQKPPARNPRLPTGVVPNQKPGIKPAVGKTPAARPPISISSKPVVSKFRIGNIKRQLQNLYTPIPSGSVETTTYDTETIERSEEIRRNPALGNPRMDSGRYTEYIESRQEYFDNDDSDEYDGGGYGGSGYGGGGGKGSFPGRRAGGFFRGIGGGGKAAGEAVRVAKVARFGAFFASPVGITVLAIGLVLLIIVVAYMNKEKIPEGGNQCLTPGGAAPAAPGAPAPAPGNQVARGELSSAEYMKIYGSTEAEVRANLVPINFQGKTVQVHKLVKGAFEKVNAEITAANTGYQFKSIGTFNWRKKNCPGGCAGLSTHSFGITMDINPATNPYTTANTHDIPPAVSDAFKRNGFGWGGDWKPAHDWMHFQYEGEPGIDPGPAQGGTDCPPAPGGGGTGDVTFIPARKDETCGGKWNLQSFPVQNNPLGNFGDPLCDYSKEKLIELIKKLENNNAEFVHLWVVIILPQETGFNPSGWAKPSSPGQCALDCAGAWGNFQMGSSTPPGKPPPAPGKNGEFDRGDVNWQMQASNAINYNRKKIGCSFWYWRGYRDKVGENRKRC